MTAVDTTRVNQLLAHGFCIFEDALDTAMLAALRATSERVLTAQSEAERARQRTTGSMASVMADPFFADIIAHPKALAALAALGYQQPTFSDGYIISKPPHSPRLFWHYDWFAWEDPRSYEPEPMQVFLMYYLSDTGPQNGCLRVIPGSHYQHNALHDVLAAPHSEQLARGENLDSVEFSQRPDEIDVPMRAGDLLLGDARLLHATHANSTDQRRTLLTLWYQPNLRALPERMQAQMAAKAQQVPESWPSEARRKVEALLPTYHGDAAPYERSLYRPKVS